MSLLDKWDCLHCGLLTGYPGAQAARHPLRAHLACQCLTDAELDAQLTETVSDPLKHLEPKRRAA